MAKVFYVNCTNCSKRYYLDELLYQKILDDPKQKAKCPFCRKEFHPKLEVKKD